MACSVPTCASRAHARGLCNAHYKRLERTGDSSPDQPVQITRDDVSRFWSKVRKTSSCWLWLGPLTLHGYPRFTTREKQHQAHRYAYELVRGPIEHWKELDHLCRVRRCVNPDHLDPVSHRENVLRGDTLAAANAAKTHCPQGHPYDAANTYLSPSGSRVCRVCTQAARDRYAARRHAMSGGQ